MSDGQKSVDTEPMMVGQRPVDRPTPMPQEGEVFAERYTIERQVGRGGMGVVYKAEQLQLGRSVAIKILMPPERIEDDPKFDERFMREAAAAAKLHHANTITVHDFGQTVEGQLFIVMEYLEGRDLRSVLRRAGVLSAERTIHIAAQICRSLREAHDMGMVHRDLKPANVFLVDRDGDPDFVKVLDFGLVKYAGEDSELTLAGKFVGSPKYTSPEALDRHKKVDHRADIYSLAILIYTMLAGQPPFSGDPIQVLTAHLREAPPPLTDTNPMARSNARLDRVIARCLQKDPEERFQTMDAVLEALLAADPTSARGERTTTLVLSGDMPASPRSKKSGWGMAALLLVAGAVIAAAIGLMIFAPSSVPEAGSEVSDPAESGSEAPEGQEGDGAGSGEGSEAGGGAAEGDGAGAGDSSGSSTVSGTTPPPEQDPAEQGGAPSVAVGKVPQVPDATTPKPRAQQDETEKSAKDAKDSEGYKSNPY